MPEPKIKKSIPQIGPFKIFTKEFKFSVIFSFNLPSSFIFLISSKHITTVYFTCRQIHEYFYKNFSELINSLSNCYDKLNEKNTLVIIDKVLYNFCVI